ncbi:MAG: TonB-dependent receptor plug domain-containing protein [Undibacterium sp.]|nr:TonB-dependent receptor plug domain-containing protein [Opitutaceae bacterium]
MKSPSSRGPFRRLLPALLVSAALRLGAQTLPKKPSTPAEEVLVLSPFTVQTSTDVGYEASESLAGTGLKTKLTDLGASVSVVTSKFFTDTGSKNLSDILVYQTNMEVRGFGGNLSGASPSGGGVSGEPSLGNGPTGTRVRGLADATQARNFFRSIIPIDGYNTDRVEINRGANALLFGVGSPAGIINTSATVADLRRQRGEVNVTGGSYGSWRGMLDVNLVPSKGNLAVRVSAVKDNENYQQDFAFTDSERRYAAANWDLKALRNRGIMDSTVISASYERGRVVSNNPRVLPPSDRLSSWFDATLPDNLRALGARGKVTYDPGAASGIFTAAARTATIGTVDNVNRSPTFVFQTPYDLAPRDNTPLSPMGQTVLGRAMVSNNVYFPWSGLTSTAQHAYSREMSRVRQDYAFPDQSFYTAENITDPSVFNFFDNILVGPNSRQKSWFDAVDVSLQQLLLKRTAGFEVSYDRQRWTESQQNLLPEGSPWISIDVNTRMWTGEANPNFGRPFISATGNASYNEQQIETSRAKAFYELNLDEKIPGIFGSILGKHVFSLLGQREELTSRTHSGGRLFYTPDTWVNGNNQSRLAPQGKPPAVWVYLGSSLANANSPAGAHISGLRQDLMNFQNQVNGKGVVLTRTPAPSAAVAQQALYNPFYTPIDLRRDDDRVSNTAGSGTLNRRILDSRAFTMQSNWLWDHLVSTVGWRKEKSAIRGINAPIIANGEGYALVDDPSFSLGNPAIVPQNFDETLFAWSAVAKTPKAWLKRVPVVSAFNAYYGESENFSPPSGRTVSAFGIAIAPPAGITKEQGIYIELFNGKLSARVNFFETTQTGSFNTTIGNLANQVVSLHSQAYGAVQNGWIPAGPGGFPVGYVAPPQQLLDLFSWKLQNGTPSSSNPGVQDTSDFVSKGKEIELMFRPTRGLSFIFNVSEQKSVRSNSGSATRRLLFNTPTASGQPLATEWLKDWTYQVPLSQAAIPLIGVRTEPNLFGPTFQRTVLNTFNTAVSADGAVVHELRQWRANFVGNYEFQGERLKGWGVGAGVRWLDKAALGYPIASFRADLTPVPAGGAALPSDIRISDVRRPYYGPTETRHDAWISYQTKILRGKFGLKIQLNVRNLLTQNELVPAVINPDGTIPVWSVAEGRKFTLSTKLSF